MKRLVPSSVFGRSSCQSSRSVDGVSVVHARELAELGVGADQPLLVIEDRDRERNRLEQGVETRDLRALAPSSDVGIEVGQTGVGHCGSMAARSLSVNDLSPNYR